MWCSQILSIHPVLQIYNICGICGTAVFGMTSPVSVLYRMSNSWWITNWLIHPSFHMELNLMVSWGRFWRVGSTRLHAKWLLLKSTIFWNRGLIIIFGFTYILKNIIFKFSVSSLIFRNTFLRYTNCFFIGTQLKLTPGGAPDNYHIEEIRSLFFKQMGIMNGNEHSNLSREIELFLIGGDFEYERGKRTCFNPTFLTLEDKLWLVGFCRIT